MCRRVVEFLGEHFRIVALAGEAAGVCDFKMEFSVESRRLRLISKRYRLRKSMGDCCIYFLKSWQHLLLDTLPAAAIPAKEIFFRIVVGNIGDHPALRAYICTGHIFLRLLFGREKGVKTGEENV